SQFPDVSAFGYDQVDDADTESLTGSPLQIAPLAGADNNTRLTPPPPLVPKNTSVTAKVLPSKPADPHTTTWELKHLNRRLHDVLSLHNSTAASDYGSEPTEVVLTTASGVGKASEDTGGTGSGGSSPSTIDARLERVAAQAIPSSTHKLSRSPSIRRLAFLKALSNSSNSNGGGMKKDQGPEASHDRLQGHASEHPQDHDHDHHHHHQHHHHQQHGSDNDHRKDDGIQRHPLATSRTFDDTTLMHTEESAPGDNMSELSLLQADQITPDIAVDVADTSDISSYSFSSQPTIPEVIISSGPAVRRNETLPVVLPSWSSDKKRTSDSPEQIRTPSYPAPGKTGSPKPQPGVSFPALKPSRSPSTEAEEHTPS
ncbi:hypothetical protein FBU59_006518, partial [Linderina macrospora]